jgi:hypothetical protein
MAHFSDRFFSANKLIIAAAVLYAGATTFARAGMPSTEFARMEAFVNCFHRIDVDPSTSTTSKEYDLKRAAYLSELTSCCAAAAAYRGH